MTSIRTASTADRDAIRALYLKAFSVEENTQVAGLAVSLLTEASEPATCNWVAEVDSQIVGHAGFSPVASAGHFVGYILAPLAVLPAQHKQGIGTKLVQHGLEQLRQSHTEIVFVYGDPDYYERFGFSAELATHFVPPYTLQMPFGWQAVALSEGSVVTQPVKLKCVSSLSDPELW